MNSKNTQLDAGRNITAQGAEAPEMGRDALKPGGANSPALAAAPVKTPAPKSPGKRARAKRGEAEGEEVCEPPECEVFSATELLVKHLTRGWDGARPFAGEWKDVFVQALARAPIVSVAARIAGVTRARALEARAADAEFARRWDAAMEEGTDEIEAAAFRSAVYGEEKPVYHQGEIKGWTVEYSHAMRSILLKSRRPDVYGDKEEAKEQGPKPMTLEEFRKRVEEARQK